MLSFSWTWQRGFSTISSVPTLTLLLLSAPTKKDYLVWKILVQNSSSSYLPVHLKIFLLFGLESGFITSTPTRAPCEKVPPSFPYIPVGSSPSSPTLKSGRFEVNHHFLHDTNIYCLQTNKQGMSLPQLRHPNQKKAVVHCYTPRRTGIWKTNSIRKIHLWNCARVLRKMTSKMAGVSLFISAAVHVWIFPISGCCFFRSRR